jgi:hypothetical protein
MIDLNDCGRVQSDGYMYTDGQNTLQAALTARINVYTVVGLR